MQGTIMATAGSKEEMQGSGVEIRWRNVPNSFSRFADEYAEMIRNLLVIAKFTGTWTVQPVDMSTSRKQGNFFLVRDRSGATIRAKAKLGTGNVSWNLIICHPNVYTTDSVYRRLREICGQEPEIEAPLQSAPLRSRIEKSMGVPQPAADAVRRGEDVVLSVPVTPTTPPATPPAVLAPESKQAVPATPDAILERIQRLHARAQEHANRRGRLAVAKSQLDVIWAQLDAAEKEVEAAQADIDRDTDGAKAVAALAAIGGLV